MKPAYQQHVHVQPEMQLDDSSVQTRSAAGSLTRIGPAIDSAD
jgi:hypothetical protein